MAWGTGQWPVVLSELRVGLRLKDVPVGVTGAAVGRGGGGVKVKEKECKDVCDGLAACGPRGSYVPVGVYGWPAEL